jgi:hypothetical protein
MTPRGHAPVKGAERKRKKEPDKEKAGPLLRLASVLKERAKREGSYAKLEDAIKSAIKIGESERASLTGGPRRVDRRKLKQIVENDGKLVLSIGELRALDRYLEPHGHGLAYHPLFEKPEALRKIAETGRVAFLLGSRTDPIEPLRVNLSRWDLLSLNRIQSGLLGFSQNVELEIREVRMQPDLAKARLVLDDKSLTSMFEDGGPSLVVLGSSVGNQMAEWMLCKMAGVNPFPEDQRSNRPQLPFYFVWWEKRPYVLNSYFHLYGEDALREHSEAGEAVLKNHAACFKSRKGYRIDELSYDKEGGNTFALCAIQRREHGKIWLLVAGLTGPATYAAAKWVNVMAADLQVRRESGASPVYWSLLRAKADVVQSPTDETVEAEVVEVMDSGTAWG